MDTKSVGDRIRVARESAGHKTIEEGARATGLSASGLGKLERGDREPELDSLISIAKGYGVSLDWLAGLRSDPSGLPLGQFLVREAVVAAILETQLAEDLAKIFRDADPLEWWHQVEPQTRVTTLEEWLQWKERVRKHVAPLLPDAMHLWTKKKVKRK